MDRVSLKDQISKLGHNISEVRLRAIDNILFKLSVNLLDLNELCAINNGEILNHCIEWFYDNDNREKYNSMLILIDKICNLANNKRYIEYFLDKHLPSFLHKLSLKHRFNQSETDIIQQIITKLISSPKYTQQRQTHSHSHSISTDHGSDTKSNSSDTKESPNESNTDKIAVATEWRFPYIALIRSDIEYLFDISLRLKVENRLICEYALLEVKYSVLSDFAPEIILQTDTHLLHSLLLILNSNNCDLVNECLDVCLLFIDRINNSLHLRYDPSIITHPHSKYNIVSHATDADCDNYEYPNDLSLDLMNNNKNMSNIANMKCISIECMLHKLCNVAIGKLLLNEKCKYDSLNLMHKIFDTFIFNKKKDFKFVISIVNAYKSFIESVDLTNMSVFTIQNIAFLVKLLRLLPNKYVNNVCIGSYINLLLSSFVTNHTSKILHFSALYKDIISILYYLEPQTNKKLKYVSNVLLALDKLTADKNMSNLDINELKQCFVALPFNLKLCPSVIQSILEHKHTHYLCILLQSPSSHITVECLNAMSENIHLLFALDSLCDIIYVLLVSLSKHANIREKVSNLLQLLYVNSQSNTKHKLQILTIYRQLYPLLSLCLINTPLNGIVNALKLECAPNNDGLCIINQFRLCFHSDLKIRCNSHKKIIDFYLESIVYNTENEEKVNKMSEIQNGMDISGIDIEKEKSVIDELIRISNYDLFHYDEMKKYALKYAEKKQEMNESLHDIQSMATSFEMNDIYKIISILSNPTLEVSLKITAANQLLIVFRKNKKYWNILRNQKILNVLIANMHKNKKNYTFIAALLEMMKLIFEINMYLDEVNLPLAQYQKVIISVLYINFVPNTKIRYLFSNIIALIVFHTRFLLSQQYRNKKYIQNEKESYAPKLLISHSDSAHINHIWVPKFISNYVYLLFPQHKIRWTSHFTKLFYGNNTFIDANDQKIKTMITQRLQMRDDCDENKENKCYEMEIANTLLEQLKNCKNHSEFMQFISQIVSLFDFSDFLNRFCSQSTFYTMLERILSVAPLSSNDDRVFVTVLKCVNSLIKSPKFLNIMRKKQFQTANTNNNNVLNVPNELELPTQLLLKLNAFINNIYIKYITDIPTSNTNPISQTQSQTQLLQSGLASTKVMALSEIFDFFETFILFISKHDFIDQSNEYKHTLHNITNCIIQQLLINPISYQHILPTNALIADNIRLQLALKCLLSVFTQSTSITSNQLFVEKYDNILALILDICSRNKTPNAFCFKNQFKQALVCLDFMLEHFISDARQVYEHHKHLSWLIRLLSDRECLVKSLGFSVFASLLRCSDNDSNASSLKLILSKNREFIDYMFGAINTSSATLVRIYSMDCLRIILNLYLFHKSQTQKSIAYIDDDRKSTEFEEKKEEKDSDLEIDLVTLMNKYVLNRIEKEIDITKLLNDVTGNATYFKSICQLLKTLIICGFDKFKNVPFEAMHFARFRHLLYFNEYKIRYFEHIKLLNIPNYFKSEKCLNYSWLQSEGNLQCLASAVSVLDIFNTVLNAMISANEKSEMTTDYYAKMTLKSKNVFVLSLMEQNCVKHCMDLLSEIVTNEEWELTVPIFKFFTNLITFKPNAFRDIIISKRKGNKSEEWISIVLLKHLSKCVQFNEESNEEIILLHICNFLFELCQSFPVNTDQFTATYYRQYNVNLVNPTETSPHLLTILNHFISKIVEKSELFEYENSENQPNKLPFMLDKYYETLGVIVSVSTMSKIILCYHCQIGDFVKYITNRLQQMMAVFILKSHSANNNNKLSIICNEIIRILQLIQNILYLAPSEIKNTFVEHDLGQLLIKLYPSTLQSSNKLIHELHDMLLSVCVNFIAHSQNAKYVLCFGDNKRKKNAHKNHDFLLNILREAFNSKTRLNSYLLCFDILDSMMLNIDGINVLICNFSKYKNGKKNQKIQTNLLQKCINLINAVKVKKEKYKHRRISCMKLLRNLAMQTLGQNILIKQFLPNKLYDIIAWIDMIKSDERFMNVYCQFLRNLGFVSEFKIAFANNKGLLLKVFEIIIDHKQEQKLLELINEHDSDSQKVTAYLKLMLDTKLSLITLIWCLVHKNQKNILFIRNLPSQSLQPLVKRIGNLNKKIVWNQKLNHTQILLNSLLDRLKLVNKLLIGL